MVAIAAWEFPTTVAAVLVALGVIGKSAHWLYKWAVRVDQSLEYVREELSFNSGSTTRDAIKRIEGRIETIETNQADVAAELQAFRVKADAVIGAMQNDVSTLLEHDAERDTTGRRYGGNEPQEDHT